MAGAKTVQIRPLTESDAAACVEVARSIPAWFSYPGALEIIGESASTQRGFVAVEHDEVCGFVTLRPALPDYPQFSETVEITYLAVAGDRRRSGIGQQLLRAAARLGLAQGARALCLLTLGPSSQSPDYAETVAFYRSQGLWCTKELRISEWGGATALVMSAPIEVLTGG